MPRSAHFTTFMKWEGDSLLEGPLHSTLVADSRGSDQVARGRDATADDDGATRRRSLPHGQKSGARIVDLFGGGGGGRATSSSSPPPFGGSDRTGDIGLGIRSPMPGAVVRVRVRPSGRIWTEFTHLNFTACINDVSDRNRRRIVCIVPVGITETNRLFLPRSQQHRAALCSCAGPSARNTTVRHATRSRHLNGIKISAPFCGDDAGGRSILANARSWASRRVGDMIN